MNHALNFLAGHCGAELAPPRPGLSAVGAVAAAERRGRVLVVFPGQPLVAGQSIFPFGCVDTSSPCGRWMKALPKRGARLNPDGSGRPRSLASIFT